MPRGPKGEKRPADVIATLSTSCGLPPRGRRYAEQSSKARERRKGSRASSPA